LPVLNISFYQSYFLERVNVDLEKDEQVFLQLVRKTKDHVYTFHSGLGNTTRRRFTNEEKAYKPIVGPIELIDANKVSELSFANANIVSPLPFLPSRIPDLQSYL
jgi:hypothetical protein